MVQITALPEDALLQVYAQQPDCYTDCFSATVPRDVDLPEFTTAFYSGWLFGLERMILKLVANRPSTTADIAALASGETDKFAAWSVEGREPGQILLCDMHGRTRSWLCVAPEGANTRVYFGSAVTPPPGESDLGFVFKSLLRFHKLYSRALLSAATRAL